MAEIVDKVIVEGAEELGEKLFGGLFKGGEKVAKEGVEKAAKEGVEKVAGEGVAAGEAAVAGEDVAAAREAAEEAAEKVAAAEAVTIESEAELEATIKAENEAVEAAEKAAEVEAGLGSRIGQKLKKYMLAALKGALELIIRLAKDAGPLLLLQVAIDEVPQEHRKELAVWAMMLAGGGNDLALVAFLFMGVSGGSEEGKQVAKEAQDVVQGLHDNARDMSIDSPSNVPIDEQQLKQVKVQRQKDQKDIGKLKDFMGNLKGMLKNRQDDKPIIEEKEEENNGSRVMNTMTLAWVGSALGAAGAEGAAAGAAEAKKAAAKEAAETAKAAAEKKAATEAAAAAAAAAEAAAAEAVMVESKAGIEATVKAETEAVEVAIQAARLGRRLGARMGAVEGKKIEAGLEEAQHLLNRLTNSAWSIFLLNTKNEELPRAYRKVLAGWGMTVAAEGIKLVLVAYNYMGLSGGSKLGKMVAKNAQEMVKRLHDKARKLLLIEEEEVPINKKTHDHLMEKIQHHVDSEKQELGKLKDILDQIDDSMNKYMKDHPLLLLKTPTQHVERKAA